MINCNSIGYAPHTTYDPELVNYFADKYNLRINSITVAIAAAILYDKIIRMCNVTPRKDGFCWYTLNQFKAETGLGRKAFEGAQRILCNKEEDGGEGVVEKKVTYIVGTQRPATHFKVLEKELPYRGSMFRGYISEMPHKDTSEMPHECISVNTINNTKKRSIFDKIDDSPSSTEQQIGSSDSPFDEEAEEQAKEEQEVINTKNALNKKAGRIVGLICKERGVVNRGNKIAVVNVKRLLNEGYTEEEIVDTARWAATSDFYKEKPLHAQLGYDAAQQAEMIRNKNARFGGTGSATMPPQQDRPGMFADRELG